MSAPFVRADWVANSNIYEVNLRQYTREGSFAAFGRELPRLRDMGIEILWFMPIHPISLERRKGSLGSYYACSDYTATNPEYGSIADFKQLVSSAHELGFRVIIDWVANHTGWDHRWTRENDSFYRKNNEGQFYDAHGWDDVIDLNYDNPAMRQAMIDAMAFWIRECNIDGFRCDMAMLVPLDFWRQARTQLDPLKKELFWLAECEEIAYHEVFDVTYTWQFLHKMESVWRKESGLNGLDEVLGYYKQAWPAGSLRTYFTSNHDENSHSGSEYERMGESALAYSVLSCTWDGMPMIYSGQEMPNRKRLAFFDRDPIEWTGQYELHGHFKRLLSLRKRNAALRGGDASAVCQRLHTGSDDRCFAFLRKQGAEEVVVALNMSWDALQLTAAELSLAGRYEDIFTGALTDTAGAGGGGNIAVKPWGFIVLEKKKGDH